MPFYTPLRYPGGKRKLARFLELLIKANKLEGCTYVEPYAGGAGLALHLLFNQLANKLIINDIDKSVFAFWYSVLHYPDELCRMIHDTPVTMDVWYAQKAVHLDADKFSLLELGFSTFFLNRTNRSGILSAGVIGGKAQNGRWKLDARFKKDELIARIQAIAEQGNQIELYEDDAIQLLERMGPRLRKRPALFYLDPPYYHKGSMLYQNFYEPEDHENVARRVEKLSSPWLVSYDNARAINALYSQYRSMTYSLNYTAHRKVMGDEFMAFSDHLQLPENLLSGTMKISPMHNIQFKESA